MSDLATTSLRKQRTTQPMNWGIYVVLLLLVIVASFLSPYFLSVINIFNVLRQVAALGMISIGMSFVILTGNGGVDLSVGSTASLVSCLTAGVMMGNNEKLLVALLASIGVGLLVGLLNGIFITKVGTDPFITTLAMMVVVQGATMMYTKGAPFGSVTKSFRLIGEGMVGPIPVPVIVFLAFFALGIFILTRTTYGRYLYAIGGNQKATWLSGINVDKFKISVYVISSFTAVIGGFILLGRVGIGEPHLADGFELDAIAATIIGGITFAGGVGRLSGTLAGVLILAIMSNLLNLMDVSPFAQQMVKGFIILGAIFIPEIKKMKFVANLGDRLRGMFNRS